VFSCVFRTAHKLQPGGMRRIDVGHMDLVHYGRQWPHSAPPCNRAMIAYLERNEGLVYWLQPRGAGVELQIPALRLKDGFYTLSLRMMKAIWRHVRLRKGFCNLERAQLGGFKLRIPAVLLTEKMRTQSRFNVSFYFVFVFDEVSKWPFSPTCEYLSVYVSLQVMRMLHNNNSNNNNSSGCSSASLVSPPFAEEDVETPPMVAVPPPAASASLLLQRAPMSAAAKISRLVDELFLPMALEPGEQYTSFVEDAEGDEERAAVTRLCELRPWIAGDRAAFVEAAGELFDRHVIARLV